MKMFLGLRRDDFDGGKGVYELGTIKKEWDKESGFAEGYLTGMCSADFEAITGIALAIGQVRRVNCIKFDLV